MPWWTWIALAAFAAVLLAGAAFGVVAWKRVRALQRSGDALRDALDDLSLKAETLEARSEHASRRVEEAERRLARLNGSLERFSVLTWALGDARRGIAGLRGAIRK